MEGGTVIFLTSKGWQVPKHYLENGDFYTKHQLWYSRPYSSREAEKLVEWVQSSALNLASLMDKSTHSRGSKLTLVFTDIPRTNYNFEEHLHTSLHHLNLLSAVPCVGYPGPIERALFKVNPEVLP